MLKLAFTKPFLKKVQKLIDTPQKKLSLEKTLYLLERGAFSPQLHTHKVQSRKYGVMFSSRVTGDLRIIWNFDSQNRLILLLLDLGGHEGSGSVYLSI